MKFLKGTMLAAVAAVATLATPAMAVPITYTFTGTFSGVNGGAFSDVDATFTGVADTDNILTNGYSYYTQLSSLQAVSPTAGTFNITDPSYFYINGDGYAGLVFNDLYGDSYFSGNNGALLGYDGKSSIGPVAINYFSGINATFNTDRNSVTITNATNGTFAAMTGAVPEPATWAMMILGMGAVGFAMRRRQKNVTTTVAYAA
ncbi:PEPxxWA-CTERM sorting domain-containing protein [Sphingomonas sp. A2-49]|uniref:PEPxxWA-CTERM sorting domain-containing protein n=1 Tax=Sphingomonas sp. A2-49 TaxID=1391375 RepID=UPI0021D2CC7C|nr:PEPxxWA-CTERM sorting domain-containing protein [Sphingomonas sp. A2-49]MCU6456053.1 PEPxxWA-CTERM sorting domain-containing protein [Sphingomonas sp. A2-49]